MPDNRPIGVFDSGVGGLTVLRALQEELPAESTIYVGDLARCPYGPRPQEQVREFALQIADLLVGEDIKMLVIACNTATAAAFTHLLDRYPLPVIGVVEPGAQEAARMTRNNHIGVIATDGTVASGAYSWAILQCLPDARVEERSASWLVPLLERGPLPYAQASAGLAPVLSEFRTLGIDTLILGCTHFPLVRDIFAQGIGPDVALLDSAATTAVRVREELVSRDLLASGVARHRLLVTGPAAAFAQRAQAMFHASPRIETVELGALARVVAEPGELSTLSFRP